MVSDQLFEQGRRELEELLNRELAATEEVRNDDIKCWHFFLKDDWENLPVSDQELKQRESELKRMSGLIYIRTTEPYFVAEGSHQAILDVGNGLVAKVSYSHPGSVVSRAERFASMKSGLSHMGRIMRGLHKVSDELDETYDSAREKKLRESTYRKIGSNPLQHFPETLRLLEEHGLDVMPISLYRLVWSENRIVVSPDIVTVPFDAPPEEKDRQRYPNIYLTPDLRENGRYKVVDYREDIARGLVNGDALISKFEDGYQKLLRFESNTKSLIFESSTKSVGPYFSYNSHYSDKTAIGAIRKMFLLQVPMDKREEGKLVIGDFDHVCVFL